MSESELGRKIGHTVFCERYKEFSSDRAETFINYFSLLGVSLVIVSPRKNAYELHARYCKKITLLRWNYLLCEYRMTLTQNQGDIRNQLVEMHRMVYNSECFLGKKLFPIGPTKF